MYVESITVTFSSLFVSAVLEYQIAWKLGKNIHSLLQSSLSLGLRLVCVCVCVCVFVNLFQEDAKFSVVSCTSVMLELEQQTFKGNLEHIVPECLNKFCLNR